jgi:hypothetical protein
VLSDGASLALYLDGENVGFSSLDDPIRVGQRVTLGYDGNPDMITSSILLKNLHISNSITHQRTFSPLSSDMCSRSGDNSHHIRIEQGILGDGSETAEWFWRFNGSVEEEWNERNEDDESVSVWFNDLRYKQPQLIPFAIIVSEEIGKKKVEDRKYPTREVIEVFASTPAVNNLVDHHRPLPTLNVIYYSSSSTWDAYWELYHNWLVNVLLADVRKKREVTILVFS